MVGNAQYNSDHELLQDTLACGTACLSMLGPVKQPESQDSIFRAKTFLRLALAGRDFSPTGKRGQEKGKLLDDSNLAVVALFDQRSNLLPLHSTVVVEQHGWRGILDFPAPEF